MTASIPKTPNNTMKMTKTLTTINSTHTSKYRPPFRKLPLMKRSPQKLLEFHSSTTSLCQQQQTCTASPCNLERTGGVVLDRLCQCDGQTESVSATVASVSCHRLLDFNPSHVVGDENGVTSQPDDERNSSSECRSDCTNATSENEAAEANDSGGVQPQSADNPLKCLDVPLMRSDCAGDKPSSIKLARRTVAPLKFDHSSMDIDESDEEEDDDETASSGMDETDSLDSQYQRRKRTIRFHSYVKVVRIPNRHAYTSKQKRRLWNGNGSIRANSRRNRKEFEWEGWKWQNVIEEDKFCLVEGQLVHPAHVLV